MQAYFWNIFEWMALLEAFVCRLKTSSWVLVIHCDFEVTLFIRAKDTYCLSEVQEEPLGMYDFQGCQKELKQQDQRER